jgi:oligogalacturonide lyase
MVSRRSFLTTTAGALAALGLGRHSEAEETFVDEQTGHRVRILAGGSASGLYFHQNCFTAGGDKMVYRAPTPEGGQSFVLDFASGESRQLTREPGGTNSEVVGARSRRLYYRAGNAIKSISVDAGEAQTVCELPGNLTAYPFALSADEKTLASGYVEGGEEIAKLPRGEMFVKMFDAKLRNVIYTIDIQTGRYEEVYEENTWLGHFQFSPTDPNTLMFCHEGPWERLDRIWLLDMTKRESRLVFKRRREGEIAGHEFWHPDGTRVWFDLRHRADGEFALANVELATGGLTAYPLKAEEWCVHYNIEPKGTWLCGDGGRDGPWIYRFDPQPDGTAQVTKLCSMAGHDYVRREPNVHVTPDAQWVVFTANMAGPTEVRAVSAEPEDG